MSGSLRALGCYRCNIPGGGFETRSPLLQNVICAAAGSHFLLCSFISYNF